MPQGHYVQTSLELFSRGNRAHAVGNNIRVDIPEDGSGSLLHQATPGEALEGGPEARNRVGNLAECQLERRG